MKKMISALLVVVFAILAMAIPAQAQGRRGDIVDVISSRVAGGGYNRGGYDRYDRYDQGTQCNYDRYRRPYNCRRYDRRIGAWVPFAVGVVVGAVATNVGNRQRPEPAVQQVPHEAPVETNTPQMQTSMTEFRSAPVAGPAANQGEGEFELSNSTRMYVEAYDGKTYLGRMSPGTTLKVGPPKDRYQGFALIPNRKGGLSKDEIEIEPGDSGWSFIEPKVAQGR